MKTRTRVAVVASLAVASISSTAAATPGVPLNGAVAIGQWWSTPNGSSEALGFSGDGRYAIYTSTATNLVDGDNNSSSDVFFYDRAFARTLLMSVATTGGSGNGLSGPSNKQSRTVTDDGRFVLFTSYASNLITGDGNGAPDGFLRDNAGNGSTTRVTLSAGGGQIPLGAIAHGMSSDAQLILFSTRSSLSVKDQNTLDDLYLYDRAAARVTLVSANAAGNAIGGSNDFGTLSDNGRYVAFSTSWSLVPSDTNAIYDVYWRDLLTNTTQLVSTNQTAVVGNGNSYVESISADGQTVAFRSVATNLVPGDTNNVEDIFVKRIAGGTIVRASTATSGVQVASPTCNNPRLSANGNIVAMECAPNLVPGGVGGPNMYTKDVTTGLTTRISVTQSGVPGGGIRGIPNADGTLILFSGTDELVPLDSNGLRDVVTGNRL